MIITVSTYTAASDGKNSSCHFQYPPTFPKLNIIDFIQYPIKQTRQRFKTRIPPSVNQKLQNPPLMTSDCHGSAKPAGSRVGVARVRVRVGIFNP